MAPETLVREVQQILEDLRAEYGPFSLAMLYSSFEGGSGGWNVIISAPWAAHTISETSGQKVDGISLLVDRLSDKLSPENKTLISRVTVLEEEDPFVVAVTSAFSVASPGSTTYISNTTLAGVPIPRAILFYSQRPVPAGAGQGRQ